MTYQVEQHQIKRGHEWWDYCEEVCFASKNLFNTALYTNRQSFIYGHGVLSQAELDKMFNSDIHVDAEIREARVDRNGGGRVVHK
jgi:putative transposase